ncbi:MAG: DUF934 domain-containing protein [Geminicoccaceae bacterium]|nr:DUF934 domain-containing protein [Geminicoccaceae bacterium]
MPLLKKGVFVEDAWIFVADDVPIPSKGPIVVGLDRLEAEGDAIAPARRLGVRLKAGERVERLAPHLQRLDLVALEFPVFSDGRAFSAAAMLRKRMGFAGEIRATGQVRVDLHPFMRRTGFDAFQIEDDARVLRSWRDADIAVDLAYQPDDATRDGPLPVWEARRRHRREAA